MTESDINFYIRHLLEVHGACLRDSQKPLLHSILIDPKGLGELHKKVGV